MLSMLFLLVAAPQSAIPGPPAAPSAAATPTACRDSVTRATDTSSANGLMWRGEGQPVGLYRLLERRIDGCSAPLIVNYRVPGLNALGRQVGPVPARPVPRP